MSARQILPSSRPVISPSLLSSDFARLAEEISAVEEGGADLLHVDVMDGHFVPNLTIGLPVIRAINKYASKPLDVHLMITNAEQYLQEYKDAGADILTVHQEACTHLHRTLTAIRDLGMAAGVSINPATPVSTLSEIIRECDLVLVMSVNPGFGGQSFIEHTHSKLRELRSLIAESGSSAVIEVDGGVTKDNAAAIVDSGADVLVSGSAIFGADNYRDYINAMKGVQ
ncbi:MAG: ribulose-phosphate 3-epimerase [Ectothiorhodospiraceae bacterium]|nr:ribulose-phosphate 3-epimerase [Ectothiorhodospiraceae bacterium]